MIAWRSVLYASVMALIDSGMLSIIKKISMNTGTGLIYMIIPTLVYACQPWLFLSAIKTETMTVMNLLWDLISDILVSIIGIIYFKEFMGPIRMTGLFLGIISLILLSWKEYDGIIINNFNVSY